MNLRLSIETTISPRTDGEGDSEEDDDDAEGDEEEEEAEGSGSETETAAEGDETPEPRTRRNARAGECLLINLSRAPLCCISHLVLIPATVHCSWCGCASAAQGRQQRQPAARLARAHEQPGQAQQVHRRAVFERKGQ